jgi:hypothetical protein
VTITTSLLVNAVAVIDIVTVIDDLENPSHMSAKTTVTLREVPEAPSMKVGLLSTKVEMTPEEIKLMEFAEEALAEYANRNPG